MKLLTLNEVQGDGSLIERDLAFVSHEAKIVVDFNDWKSHSRSTNPGGLLNSLAVVGPVPSPIANKVIVYEVGLCRTSPYSDRKVFLGERLERVKIEDLVTPTETFLPVCQSLMDWVKKETAKRVVVENPCIEVISIKIYRDGQIYHRPKKIFPRPACLTIHVSSSHDREFINFLLKAQLFCNWHFNSRLRAFIVHADMFCRYCSKKRALEEIQQDDTLEVLQNKEWLRYAIIMYGKCHSLLLQRLQEILDRNFFVDVTAGIYGDNTRKLRQGILEEQQNLLTLSGGIQIELKGKRVYKNSDLNKYAFKIFADPISLSELQVRLYNLREYVKQTEIEFPTCDDSEPAPF